MTRQVIPLVSVRHVCQYAQNATLIPLPNNVRQTVYVDVSIFTTPGLKDPERPKKVQYSVKEREHLGYVLF